MAFNANKVVLKNQNVAPVQAPQPDPVLSSRFKTQPASQVVSDSVQIHKNSEPTVVVNGKAKKISKKSAFLLDMLTFDD
jgi:DsbC/DsbD-like thiol-disulfide interchange protein